MAHVRRVSFADRPHSAGRLSEGFSTSQSCGELHPKSTGMSVVCGRGASAAAALSRRPGSASTGGSRRTTQTRCLPRAAWGIATPPTDPGAVPACGSTSRPLGSDAEAMGARLVSEIATGWGKKYSSHIRNLRPEGSTYHYECLLSVPTKSRPVPSVVVSVRFAFITSDITPRLLFGFEEDDLRHEWKLKQDFTTGRWMPTDGQQISSLRNGTFEHHLDFIVRCKEKVKSFNIDLKTPFEQSRLALPVKSERRKKSPTCRSKFQSSPGGIESEASWQVAPPVEEQARDEMVEVMRYALKVAGLSPDQLGPHASLEELLANIFDAADEDGVGVLPHHEVARLLGSMLPGLGLQAWDISQLMSSAEENDDGFINYKPFIRAAPPIIKALRQRRLEYEARGLPGVKITAEAAKFCFGDEAAVTAEFLDICFQASVEEDRSRGTFCAAPCGSPSWSNAPRRSSMSSVRRSFVTDVPGMQVSPKESLRQRRSSTSAKPGVISPSDSRRTLRLDDAFDARTLPTSPSEQLGMLVGLKRRFCRACLESATTRVSPQEATRLMQTLPEDEFGFVQIGTLADTIESCHAQAILNAVIESDPQSLKTHLQQHFKALDSDDAGQAKLWDLKRALLSADQVYLSRLQIHVLLCLASFGQKGDVDHHAFQSVCCTVIPHMFDAKSFVDKAERLQLEHQEELKRSETAELAALGKATVGALASAQEEPEEKEMDEETAEKILIQVLSQSDSGSRNESGERMLRAQTVFSILTSTDPQVMSCGFSAQEVTGLLAEMAVDDKGEVAFVEHMRRWVPVVFELRRNRVLSAYIKDEVFQTLCIKEQQPDDEDVQADGSVKNDASDPPSRRSTSRQTEDDLPEPSRSHRPSIKRSASPGNLVKPAQRRFSEFASPNDPRAQNLRFLTTSYGNNTRKNSVASIASSSVCGSEGNASDQGSAATDPKSTPAGRGQRRRRLLLQSPSAPHAALPTVAAR